MAKSRLNYEETGAGLPVVLIHGFPFDHTIWQAQLEGLGEVARMIGVDVPGFGGSKPLEGKATINGYADAIADWAEKLELGRFVLAGHSMGGYIALAFVRRHSEMLAGLVLVCTKSGADTEEARQNRYKQAEEVKERGPQVVVEAMLPKLLAPNTYESKPEIERRLRTIMLRQKPEGIVAALHAMAARDDSTDFLDSIRVPTLVLAGAEDKIIPPTEGEKLAERIKNARYEAIEGTAHMPMMEDPTALNRALAGFLEQLSPRGS
jgi:3-oxoadipate enol-lactonase